MTINIELLTTSGCHLCDKALSLFKQSRYFAKFNLVEVDIIECSELLENYGTKIPVFRVSASEQQLCWPFSILDLDQFLEQCLRS